jgi:hypothetical protein
VAPADVAQLLFGFGLVPLVLARDFVRDVPPWSFGLTPGWAAEQLGFFVLAGAILGLTSSRPATGLAAVAIGILLGLAADLWWLTGFVRPEDQDFVSLLSQAEWRSRLIVSALALVATVSAGFSVGAVVRRLVRDRSRRPRLRPAATDLVAVGVALIGGPLLAFGIASAAASSALVVPDGSQVQTVRFSAGTITVDPSVLRPGQTRFLCLFEPDSEVWGALLVAIPEGTDVGTLPPIPDYHATCDPGAVDASWGTVAELGPGQYAWQQIDNSAEIWRVIATSPVVVVTPQGAFR